MYTNIEISYKQILIHIKLICAKLQTSFTCERSPKLWMDNGIIIYVRPLLESNTRLYGRRISSVMCKQHWESSEVIY